MSVETYHPITGNLQPGYACLRCGDCCNMLATGHGEGECEDKRDQFKYDIGTGKLLDK